jgi:hypothetical protein
MVQMGFGARPRIHLLLCLDTQIPDPAADQGLAPKVPKIGHLGHLDLWKLFPITRAREGI